MSVDSTHHIISLTGNITTYFPLDACDMRINMQNMWIFVQATPDRWYQCHIGGACEASCKSRK